MYPIDIDFYYLIQEVCFMLIHIVVVSADGVGFQEGGPIHAGQLGDGHAGHRRHRHLDGGGLALRPGGGHTQLCPPAS